MLRASKRSRLREDESAMSSFAPGELDFVDIELAPPSLAMERRDNGEIILRSTIPLADHARHVGEHLLHWAKIDPKRSFLAERDAAGVWQHMSYGD